MNDKKYVYIIKMKVRKKNVTKKRIYKKKSIKKMRKKNKKTLKHKYIKKGGNNQLTITKEEINSKMEPISLMDHPIYNPYITEKLLHPEKVEIIKQKMINNNLDPKFLYESEDNTIVSEEMIGKIFKCNNEYYILENWTNKEGFYKKLNVVSKCKYAKAINICKNHYKFVKGKVNFCTTKDSYTQKRGKDWRSPTKCTSSTITKKIQEIPEIINSNMVPHGDYYILKTKEEEEEEKKEAEKKEEEEEEAERRRIEEETREIASVDSQKLSTNPQTSNKKVIYDPNWVPYKDR